MAGPQTPSWEEEERFKKPDGGFEADEKAVHSAHMEPGTLEWPGAKAAAAERASVMSECPSLKGGESRTESQRELGAEEQKPAAPAGPTGAGGGGAPEEKRSHLEVKVEEINSMPDEAARVFTLGVTESQREYGASWDEVTEKSHFLGSHGVPTNGYHPDWQRGPPKRGCDACHRDSLKAGAAVFSAALVFPLLVWGGYMFLPFDAPVLESAPLRLVYTLRCSVFAIVPIVLGLLVLGASRLHYRYLKPLCEGNSEPRQVAVHQRFVEDSVSLFLLYFLQLAVMAAYLTQDLLKLVPLLTIVFALGRLCYWLGAALGSSVRGFGFGLSFLPMLAMLVANLYFIFIVDADGSIFSDESMPPPNPRVSHRQRFWG
ncbi:transmembrane protein 79 isoform X2 [Denticeps clupeoides]|uniref:Transmembrane protein 79 n=1 Tax=Denticeps clupeoides TaxID=299321 RepID=A0AAY4C498_9TELE|nr:transmembrane protein 79-like isoform X2 [Denticeps clupeoides]